jgi:hypothetical protein
MPSRTFRRYLTDVFRQRQEDQPQREISVEARLQLTSNAGGRGNVFYSVIEIILPER